MSQANPSHLIPKVKLITCFHDSLIYNFFQKIFFALFTYIYKVGVFYWDKKKPVYLFIRTEIDNLKPSRKWSIQFCEKIRRFRIREKYVMNSLQVEMFVKMYPSPHEELEDIESSDDETEICEIETPERSPSKKQRSPRKERKPWKTFMHYNAQWDIFQV